MWSLPDIKEMNARKAANVKSFRRQARLRRPSRKHPCECCGKSSTIHLPYYDIFSDDVSGVTHLCAVHDPAMRGDQGFFDCAKCGRRMIENITWELYAVSLNGSDPICLKCAAEHYFADKANWIDPAKVKGVVLPNEDDPAPLFAGGILNIRRCKHVLGVGQTPPVGIMFHDNAEFDSCDGHQISGRDLLDVIRELHDPFCPVLDAAYQFAVSIGIYVRCSAESELQEAA
jgi:hypothetical protein